MASEIRNPTQLVSRPAFQSSGLRSDIPGDGGGRLTERRTERRGEERRRKERREERGARSSGIGAESVEEKGDRKEERK